MPNVIAWKSPADSSWEPTGPDGIAWLILVAALVVVGLGVRSRLLRSDGGLYVVSAPPATRGDN